MGPIDGPLPATAGAYRPEPFEMPSLFRFLFVLAIICGVVYGAVYSLANFVPLKQREITVTITQDKFLKR